MPKVTVVSVPESGAYVSRVPLDGDIGTIIYSFTEIEQRNSHEIECLIKAEAFLMDSDTIAFSGRLNLHSLSSREAFLRSWAKMLPSKSIAIDKGFSESIEEIKRLLLETSSSHWFEEVPPEHGEMLFEPFLVKNAPNIFFGKGGGGKTYTCLRLALSLSSGKEFMGFLPKNKVKTLFLDYEDNAATFSDRIYRLCSGGLNLDLADVHGQIRYMSARGIPLPDLLQVLKKEIKDHGIGLLIVDSAVAACGGAPESAELAQRYFNALARLGITSLTIAHETKSENHAYPFGSVFWYNFPRSIWNVRSVHDEKDEDDSTEPNGEQATPSVSVIETGLFHRKANNGPKFRPIPLRIRFDDDKKSVSIQSGSMDPWEEERPLKSRIRSLLKGKMYTTMELKDLLPDVSEQLLYNSLNVMKRRGDITQLGTKGSPWLLVEKSS